MIEKIREYLVNKLWKIKRKKEDNGMVNLEFLTTFIENVGKKYLVKNKINKRRKQMNLEKIKVWSLYYRSEIIWFVIGFVIGAIIS